jgi:hypothetical protein
VIAHDLDTLSGWVLKSYDGLLSQQLVTDPHPVSIKLQLVPEVSHSFIPFSKIDIKKESDACVLIFNPKFVDYAVMVALILVCVPFRKFEL